MLHFLKRFWRSLLVVGALVGLLYLPADVAGIPTVVQPLLEVFISIDREWLLLGFGAIVSTYIVWMDVRPLLTHWLSSRRRRLIQVESVRHSVIIDTVDGKLQQGRFRRIYSLPVRNISGRTLRHVQLAYSETGPYGRLPLVGDDEQFETDLHPGEVVSFRLGETDLGVGSTSNLFDNNDERYATTANFKSETIGGLTSISGTRLRGAELERISKLRPEKGIIHYKMALTASAEDVSSAHISLIVTLDYKNAKVMVAPATTSGQALQALSPVPKPQ